MDRTAYAGQLLDEMPNGDESQGSSLKKKTESCPEHWMHPWSAQIQHDDYDVGQQFATLFEPQSPIFDQFCLSSIREAFLFNV